MLKAIDEVTWKLEKQGEMKKPAIIIGTKKIVKQIKKDRTLEQLKNVASLPVVKEPVLMPDAHEGYGFPIGTVAAFDAEEGIVSPGGIGYDINCGVRFLKIPISYKEIIEKRRQLGDALYRAIPAGVGKKSKQRLSDKELENIVQYGARYLVENSYGIEKDLLATEEYGAMEGADISKISKRAIERARRQLGTLGAGNHFLEVQAIEQSNGIFGLNEGEVGVMIHCGSRGFGHQICSDYLIEMYKVSKELNIELKDKELVYAPLYRKEAQDYLKAMKGAVNFAFANRQLIMHNVREVFSDIFGIEYEQMELLYDVAHNIAKEEEHLVDGKRRKLLVHRKGATRAFPKGRKELPKMYREIGQPVIIPGSMGTASYILKGEEKGLEVSFGSSCHGSGRTMSRKQAIRMHEGKDIIKELDKNGILVMAHNKNLVSEEAPDAYKDVDEVVKSVSKAGISSVVARLRPLIVVKG